MSQWKNAIPNRKTLHALKREAVLQQAVTDFNQKGFHATSLEDIAHSLGLTKAALYHYFPNKHALLRASFDRALGVAFEGLEKAQNTGGSALEILGNTLKYYLRASLDDLSCCVVLTEQNALLPKDQEEVVASRDRFESALRDLVEKGMKDGSIVPCNSKLAVFALLGSVNWVPKWFSSNGQWQDYQVAEALVDVLCRSLAKNPTDSLVKDIGGLKPPPDHAEQPLY